MKKRRGLLRPSTCILVVFLVPAAGSLITLRWGSGKWEVAPLLRPLEDPEEALARLPSFSMAGRLPELVFLSSRDSAGSEARESDVGPTEREQLTYAAQELDEHLALAGAPVRMGDGAARAFRLLLWSDPDAAPARAALSPLTGLSPQRFAIVPDSLGITIVVGRAIGTLGPVSRLLEEPGFRWFDPEELFRRLNIAGARWLDPSNSYQSYDGSHLAASSARVLSWWLGSSLDDWETADSWEEENS